MDMELGEGEVSHSKLESVTEGNHEEDDRGMELVALSESYGASVISLSEHAGRITRLKMVVRTKRLRRMLEEMTISNAHQPSVKIPPLSRAEQRLEVLARKHRLIRAKVATENDESSWTPALQSIPEER